MADEDSKASGGTKIPGIAAGAIRFDSAGRILVSAEVQAEAGGFKLPDWFPGGGPGGGGGGGTVLTCPDVGCGAVTACEALTACVDVACEAGVVGCPDVDAACGTEVVGCGDVDIACGSPPEVVGCADVDAGCEDAVIACDDTACSDLFCRENQACKNDRCEINLGCGEDMPGQTETPTL